MAGPVKIKPWVNPWNPKHVVGKPSPNKPAVSSGGKGKKGGSRRRGTNGGKPGGS